MKLTKNLNILVGTFAVISFFGFIDASYLTVKHYLGTPIPCGIFGGCDVVTSSAYSQIGPVPIALIGSVYYLALLILSIYYLDSRKTSSFKLAVYLTIVAFLVSLFLVYLQIFVIQSLCLYCMISAGITAVLFLLGQVIQRTMKKENLEIISQNAI